MPVAVSPPELVPPSWAMLARELRSVIAPRRFGWPDRDVATPAGKGRPVLVIPGFLATDRATRPLRSALRQTGFRAHGWKRGRNFGIGADIFDIIDARVQYIGRGDAVAIIGWSLGGLIAREYAKRSPDRVDKVVTLGSPISGSLRQNNNVWRLYQLVAGHSIDAPPVACALGDKPPVETIAIWSARDGIVAAHGACATNSCDRSIEIACGHIEMVFAPEAIRAVLDALT